METLFLSMKAEVELSTKGWLDSKPWSFLWQISKYLWTKTKGNDRIWKCFAIYRIEVNMSHCIYLICLTKYSSYALPYTIWTYISYTYIFDQHNLGKYPN